MSKRRLRGLLSLPAPPHLTILLFHSNHTLRFMSFPVSDISQAYRSAPERTEDVWQKVKTGILSRVKTARGRGSPHPQP